MEQSSTVIEITNLSKSYGPIIALQDVSLTIAKAEIFGVVGPNGAGKTTLLECMEGLRKPDHGQISIQGVNPLTQTAKLREFVGIQLQEAALPDRIRVWEALDLYASLYCKSQDPKYLMEQFGLDKHANTPFSKLSGGQKQRLCIALSLIHSPDILFLDELTTGLDPQARHKIWDLLRDLKKQGKTIVLTTHLMEEASELCDRIAILDFGKIIALDRPDNLIQQYATTYQVILEMKDQSMLHELEAFPGLVLHQETRFVFHFSDQGLRDMLDLVLRNRAKFGAWTIRPPSLEDAFLKLTGHAIREEGVKHDA